MNFEQLRINLERAKAVYQQALTSIDSSLRAIVSQDPTALTEAREVQASYVEGFTVTELAAAAQPEAFEMADGGPAPKGFTSPAVDPASIAAGAGKVTKKGSKKA